MNLQKELYRALEHDERGEIIEAVSCLDRILDALPEHAGYKKFVGQLYQRLGEDQKGLKFILEALQLEPDDPDLHLALGYHNVDNSRLETALENFREALTLEPNHKYAQLYLGRTQDFLGDLANAEKSLIKAVALNVNEIEPHIHLGRVLLRLGKLDQAKRKFNQIEEISPGNKMAEIGRRRILSLQENRVHSAGGKERTPATVVCVKKGIKYGPDYVNRLRRMVQRNSCLEPRFVCFTDDDNGLDSSVEILPLPDQDFDGWWNKISLFRDDLPDIGRQILYFDLDVVLTGNIDEMLTYDSDFVIMDNDYMPGFNTSVFLLKTGSRPEIRNSFTQSIANQYQGDQDWVAIMAPDAELWPFIWCVPYRLRAVMAPPPMTKVVVFSGHPNPEDYPSDWVYSYWN